ncbi:MAG: glycerophosphodiester phosphodiesterase family protein [Kiritimatiellae bacterium]|nr:glycerophosphodiester phosphodiesterase family protein [Kiritimatiellia bacterium]
MKLNHLYRAFVRDAHKAGLKVTAWTVGQAEDAQLVIALGTDYVTTDIPAAQLEQKSARP